MKAFGVVATALLVPACSGDTATVVAGDAGPAGASNASGSASSAGGSNGGFDTNIPFSQCGTIPPD